MVKRDGFRRDKELVRIVDLLNSVWDNDEGFYNDVLLKHLFKFLGMTSIQNCFHTRACMSPDLCGCDEGETNAYDLRKRLTERGIKAYPFLSKLIRHLEIKKKS